MEFYYLFVTQLVLNYVHLISASPVFLFSRVMSNGTVKNTVFRGWRQHLLRVDQVRCKDKMNPIPSLQNLQQGKYCHTGIRFYESKEEEACSLWFWRKLLKSRTYLSKKLPDRDGEEWHLHQRIWKQQQRNTKKSGNGKYSDICLCRWLFGVMRRGGTCIDCRKWNGSIAGPW